MNVRLGIAAMTALAFLLVPATTSGATEARTSAPVITTQPGDVTVDIGHQAHFVVRASGKPRPSYQWQVAENGGPFVDVGASSPHLRVVATFGDEGYAPAIYRVVVSNPLGSVTSDAATLSVNESQYEGTYTINQVLPKYVNSFVIVLGPAGTATFPSGSTYQPSWSATGRVVTISDPTGGGFVELFTGSLTRQGIANPRHPGTVLVDYLGSTEESGTFYAQRTG